MRIYDITQPLRLGMPVWPGDVPFESRWSARIQNSSSVNVGAVTMSLHTGTHADAPLHVRDGDLGIDRLPLAAFLGPAVVVECLTEGAVGADAVRGLPLDLTPRVLIRTRSGPPPVEWPDNFAYLGDDLVGHLIQSGVLLVGIDTPSVDPVDSRTLSAHHALYDSGLVNIENIDLSQVPAGTYELVALPLHIEGMDASPVRAVLIAK